MIQLCTGDEGNLLEDLVQPPKDGSQFTVQGNVAVRQLQAVIQKGHLLPGEGGNFVTGQPRLPGQTQHDALRAGVIQDSAHGGLIRPVNHVFPHGRVPLLSLSLHDK